MAYDHQTVETKWQQYWREHQTFRAHDDSDKPKYYALDMFPYPSGAGLHVGHPLGYTATDIICRKRRHEGYNVLHPMGWDAFGLPAENYAIKTGEHPAISTNQNIDNFRRQIQSLGFSYDWEREFSTTDPDYYRWSQWIFLQLYKKGLAYEKAMPMNWCPKCKIVAANEEVEEGLHERCGTPVEKKNLKQWMLKITEYADRLLDDLDSPELDWPEKIKAMQRHWIGKSEGMLFTAPVKDTDLTIQTFSAHFEAFCADTFVVIAPDHPLLDTLLAGVANKAEIKSACDEMLRKRLERGFEEEREPEGVFTGRYIEDPVGNGDLPIWVASFALADYGTGIVKCSAHDERDFAFAKKYGLRLKPVLFPEDPIEAEKVKNLEYCFSDMNEGVLAEPAIFAGQQSGGLREAIKDYLEEKNLAQRQVSYKLRDWIFTRQRYWGEPIPLVFDEAGKCYPLDNSELPLVLPETPNYEPSATGESPLAKVEDWVNIRGDITPEGTVKTSPDGSTKFRRETSTMPNWAGSSWYWLRFMDPHNEQEICSKEKEAYWGPVDLYVGGAEHAVLHLLYGRFWHKVLCDLGLVSTTEPFKKLVNQGLIMAEDGTKMSKSVGNVINPDEVVEQYGADTLRCYEMFMGPFEQNKAWSTGAVGGVRKFLDRVERVFAKPHSDTADPETLSLLHQTIKQVGSDIDEFKFNTAIAQMMVLTNHLTSLEAVPKAALETFVVLLSPFAPHLTEELWQALGHTETLAFVPWPDADESYLVADTATYAIQVNGKVRGQLEMPSNADKDTVLAAAREVENVAKWLSEGTVRKEIFVPGKIVGFVVS